jgi:hypothetical protein
MPNLLSAGQNQLRQIDRQRQLAAGLQQQALSFDPIQHPLQGFAKLAQALASQQIEKRADKREKGLEKERRDALVRALQPVTEQQPSSTAQLFDESIQIPGRRTQRARTPAEALQGLPSDLAESVTGNVLQQQLLAQSGVTPQQLTSQNRVSPFMQKLTDSINAGLPQVALRGMVAKEIGLEAVNVFKPGDNAPKTALRVGGRLFEPTKITAEQPFGIGRDITDEVAQAGVSVQPTSFSAFGEEDSDAKGIQIGYLQSVGIVDSIAADVARSGDAALAFTGKAAVGINSLVQQLQASARLVGRSFKGTDSAVVDGKLTAEVGGQVVPEAQLFDPSLYDLDTSAMATTAQQAQRIKTQAIKLAYAMARADDPGGRLSERDVQAQLDAMGLDQGSADVALTALGTLREILDRNTSISLDILSEGRFEFSPEPVPAHLRNFMGQQQSPIQDFSGFRNGQELVGNDNQIYRMVNGVPQPTGEFVRQ